MFARPEARRQLEAILHPAIRQAFTTASATAGGPYQVHAIPLLAESGRAKEYERVLVVDCPRETQLQRLLARDQETPERAEAILAAYSDPAIGFISDQVAKAMNDWANFTSSSSTS